MIKKNKKRKKIIKKKRKKIIKKKRAASTDPFAEFKKEYKKFIRPIEKFFFSMAVEKQPVEKKYRILKKVKKKKKIAKKSKRKIKKRRRK